MERRLEMSDKGPNVNTFLTTVRALRQDKDNYIEVTYATYLGLIASNLAVIADKLTEDEWKKEDK